jgi:dTDP-4-dehydrorhamnose reductase
LSSRLFDSTRDVHHCVHNDKRNWTSLLTVDDGQYEPGAFARQCAERGLPYRSLLKREMDAADPEEVERAVDMFQPWAVLNAAGMSNPDIAQTDAAYAQRALVDAQATLAHACARRAIPLVTFSSDQVFGGEDRRSKKPYVESDPTSPLSVFGRLQAEAEQRVLASHSQALVVRTGAHFSPYGEHDPLTKGLTAFVRGEVFAAASDMIVTATYVVDLVNDVLDLLTDGETGLWHHAHPQALTWAELYQEAARIVGIDAARLEAKPLAKLGLPAPRPHFCALSSERGVLSPPLDQALGRYCADGQAGWAALVPEERRCREAPVPKRIG